MKAYICSAAFSGTLALILSLYLLLHVYVTALITIFSGE
jgi:hypothetical protein